jgi:hypothetical protein
MCVQSIPNSTSDLERLERLDSARDFFGDPRQRYEDRLMIERGLWPEDYRRGRLALVLDCDLPVVSVHEPSSERIVGIVPSATDLRTLVVFKADVTEHHRLQHWDEKLMLVSVVHLTEGVQDRVSSRVGFYCVEYQKEEFGGKLPFFQGTLQPRFYFLPFLKDWKPSVIRRYPITSDNRLVVHQVESASEVVKSISNRESNLIGGEQIPPEINTEKVLSSLNIVINPKSVTVRQLAENEQQAVNVRDVLVGPLNLFV